MKKELNNPEIIPAKVKPIDIFNNDDDYAVYLIKKQEDEQQKKIRISKVLDEYSFRQLNLPGSQYRSNNTDLIYKPIRFPINHVHPAMDDYNSQFIGFNQSTGSGVIRRPHNIISYQQQQQYQQQYQPNSQFVQSGQQALQPLAQNVIYNTQPYGPTGAPLNEGYDIYQIGNGSAIQQQRKRELITRSHLMERNIDNTLKQMRFNM